MKEYIRRQQISTSFKAALYILTPNGNPSQIYNLNSCKLVKKQKCLCLPTPIPQRERMDIKNRILLRKKYLTIFQSSLIIEI